MTLERAISSEPTQIACWLNFVLVAAARDLHYRVIPTAPTCRPWPHRIVVAALAAILISQAFGYSATLRCLLDERIRLRATE
ncbi:MAG: hypothetical protein WBN04_11300 [Paracoccaceae bacterium]